MAEVLLAAGLKGLQVLSTYPHSSLGKAAGILGIGRANVKSVCAAADGGESQRPLQFDFQILERELGRSDVASIVAISCGEVNTGQFATEGLDEFTKLRQLCDKYGAWLHIDGAFGLFGRVLKRGARLPEMRGLQRGLWVLGRGVRSSARGLFARLGQETHYPQGFGAVGCSWSRYFNWYFASVVHC
ncbi:hypothetical protein ACJ72_06025 [Emergomyces africanus]|uniref:Tyrosine decarboxylase n=1 Tax=Emergomyces africanus TaxID=1955775 RepID=A0A1B7NSN9_9EURO|nr:hypothetical protein ACJ72_06025 [Emergomyces africanus]